MRTVHISIFVADATTSERVQHETIEVPDLADELAGRMVASIERLADLMRGYDKPPDGGSEVENDASATACCNVSGHHSRCTVYGRNESSE